jgi:hypothetical protein
VVRWFLCWLPQEEFSTTPALLYAHAEQAGRRPHRTVWELQRKSRMQARDFCSHELATCGRSGLKTSLWFNGMILLQLISDVLSGYDWISLKTKRATSLICREKKETSQQEWRDKNWSSPKSNIFVMDHSCDKDPFKC